MRRADTKPVLDTQAVVEAIHKIWLREGVINQATYLNIQKRKGGRADANK